MSFKGLTALITGGGSGIGLATARLLLDQGASVAIAGRQIAKLKEAAQKLAAGDRLQTFSGDVASEGYAKALVSDAVRAFGHLDILINNAGVFRSVPIFDMEEDDFDDIVDVNLKGAWMMSRFAAPYMRDAGGGSIVNVSSYLAIRAHRSTPSCAYAASKAGLLGLTRSLAVELAPYKIRVNAVLPAVVNTAMLEEFSGADAVPELLKRAQSAHPIGRSGEPEDVARVIAFLCDPLNSWLTGAELPIDGGRAVL